MMGSYGQYEQGGYGILASYYCLKTDLVNIVNVSFNLSVVYNEDKLFTCPVAVPRVAGDGLQQKLMKGHLCLGVVLKWSSAKVTQHKKINLVTRPNTSKDCTYLHRR